MYQSLYRTWRVRTFSEMVGQDHVVRTLRQQARTGHFSHAYLFSGSRGTGKTSAARILSMAINCQNLQDGNPCLECEACISLQSGTTLDVFEMDAASNSRVEEIRDMLEKVSYPPQFVRNKVYIIDEVHMLSNAAFNALLKTLEEPPSHMVFILATTEPQKIPATILSRCQRFEFGRIGEKDIVERLKVALRPGLTAQPEALALIASAAEGSMRDAWSLMDMCLPEKGDLTEERVREALGAVDRGFLFDFIAALLHRDAASAIHQIDQLMRTGKDIQVFLKDLSQHLRSLIAAKLDIDSRLATKENQKRYRDQAANAALEQLTWMLERSVQAEGVLRWAAQQRTVLEVYALTICHPRESDGSLAMQARVAQLELQLQTLQSESSIPHAVSPRAASARLAEQDPPSEKNTPEANADIQAIVTELPAEPEQAALTNSPEQETVPAQAADPGPESTPPGAAEAAAPPADAIVPDEGPDAPFSSGMTPKQIWNSMLERAKKELPSVYSIMTGARFGGFQDGCYRLMFPAENGYYTSFVMADSRRTMIEQLLTQIGGQPARFEALVEGTQQKEITAAQRTARDVQALADAFGRQNVIVHGE
ncbi:MAG: DNA polymerase III subunit gamma/tau [Clostridiales bacterium]|nr:DNA polymerase III subunit gamma/tau [Clostridiales bacterium]